MNQQDLWCEPSLLSIFVGAGAQHQPTPSRCPGDTWFLLRQGTVTSRWSWLRTWRLGTDRRPAHPGLGICRARLSSPGVVDIIQKTGLQAKGLSTWAEALSLRWQRSKAEPSSPRGPPIAPPQSQPRKGHRHKKTFATLLIYSGFLPLSQWATSCRTPE